MAYFQGKRALSHLLRLFTTKFLFLSHLQHNIMHSKVKLSAKVKAGSLGF